VLLHEVSPTDKLVEPLAGWQIKPSELSTLYFYCTVECPPVVGRPIRNSLGSRKQIDRHASKYWTCTWLSCSEPTLSGQITT